MHRFPVDSSNIASAGFENGTLEVEFRSGHLYAYTEVPEHVYTALIGADSPGRHLAREVIGKYQHVRLK
jgi:KTSC domain-containing protein